MATPNEGIALLSMYNDEEDDEDEEPESQPQLRPQHHKEEDDDDDDDDDDSKTLTHQNSNDISESIYRHQQDLRSPSPEIKSKRSPTPPPWPKFQQASSTSSPLNLASYSQSSPLPPLPPRIGGGGGGGLGIVDYAHDDAAMSPEVEAEEGEIVRSAGRVVVSMEMHTSEGSFEERTPPGSVELLTPSTQPEPSQLSVLPDQLKSETDMAIDSTGAENEVAEVPEVPVDAVVSEEVQKEDPLNSFLPPPLTTKCSDELQEKINRFLAYKKAGKSFNADLRNRKDYRNPDFLQHAVRYQDIDQIGTCLSKDVFDPHGYDRSDYFDEIEADMKREMERKKTPKVDFVPGGTQPGPVAPVLKINAQIPGISASVTSGLQSVSAIADATREIKQNKKTKWDKIDEDVKNPMQSSSHDNLSAASVHAAHLSAANAGTGYTAFAQQKRREAEERRSGDQKFDRRS